MPLRVPLAILALTLLGARSAPAQDGGIAVGERPDAVVLEQLDGRPYDLGSVLGKKPVLLEFWATWCAVCRGLEPRLRAAHGRFADRVEFLVVAVGVAQTKESIQRHLSARPMPGTVLWDEEGAAVRAFDAPGTGYIVIVDLDGKVAYTGTGAEQDLAAVLALIMAEVPK